jgi:hypothetical protein
MRIAYTYAYAWVRVYGERRPVTCERSGYCAKGLAAPSRAAWKASIGFPIQRSVQASHVGHSQIELDAAPGVPLAQAQSGDANLEVLRGNPGSRLEKAIQTHYIHRACRHTALGRRRT